MTKQTERCLNYITELRQLGRSTREVRQLLRYSDWSKDVVREAIRQAQTLNLVRVYPLGIPAEYERLM